MSIAWIRDPIPASAPPAPTAALFVAPDEPLTLFVWRDPHGSFTGQVLLALAVSPDEARELIVADAADGLAPLVLTAYRAYRAGGHTLGAYRNLWSQLDGEPVCLTTPVGMRLRPLIPARPME